MVFHSRYSRNSRITLALAVALFRGFHFFRGFRVRPLTKLGGLVKWSDGRVVESAEVTYAWISLLHTFRPGPLN